MNKGADVLERSVLQAGKVFIKAGEENARAYVIQNGEVQAFIMDGDQKIIIEVLKAGAIIGERCLVVNELATISYEALSLTTVVTVTRHDFQKRLTRVDKAVVTVLEHVVQKLQHYESIMKDRAVKRSEIDDMAVVLLDSLTKGLSDDKKDKYSKAILPHINGMIKEIKRLKSGG